MGVDVELWRARIGLFNGGRGGRSHHASPTNQRLHCDVINIVVAMVLLTQYCSLSLFLAEDATSNCEKSVIESLLNTCHDPIRNRAPPCNCCRKEEFTPYYSSNICFSRTIAVMLIGVIVVYSLSLLLLLAGDVELNPGPGIDTVLTMSGILEVYEKVKNASPNWFNLGLALELSYTDLTNIKIKEHRGDNDVCLREALACRLQSGGSLTWGGICTALRHTTVARNDVAEKIEEYVESTKKEELKVGHRTQSTQESDLSDRIPQSSGPLGGAVSQTPPTLQQTTPKNAPPGSTGGTPSLLGRTNMQGMTSNLFLGGNKLPPGAPPTLDPCQFINHYKEVGHNHQMVKLGLDIDDPQSNKSKQLDPQKARQASIEKCIRALIHAPQCRDPHCKQPSCIKMKKVLTHTRECKLMLARKWNQCTICKPFILLCISHAKNCTDDACRVPLCATIKKNLKVQRAKRAFDEAMKAGFVRVNTTNLLFFGMAGTGKTSTKHLLLGLPPPEDRNSTPLASTAERVCIRQIRDTTKLKMEAQKDSPRTWKPIASDDLQRIVADVIKSHVSSLDPNSIIPQELSVALKQLEARNEPANNEPASNKPVDEIPLTSRASPTKLSDNELDGGSRDFLKIISDVMMNIQRFSDDDRTAIQEKFGSHWIYIIDSGGQPHFHNLLPLFMPKISIALYVLRLSESLDDHPLVEYYKNDDPVSKSFKSHLSVLDNFKYLVQSIQSQSENCKLVCIGTHKDRQSECTETLSDKNETFLNLAEKESIQKFTFFSNLGKKEIIFPVDCKHCDSDSKDRAKTIREIIYERSQELKNEILFPFWWFVLEIIIEKVSTVQNRKVLSKTECVEIAKALHNFHEDALCEALKFFHEHHIFHYYPAILPNVVFCDTQVLLDKVTELVEFAAYVRGGNTPIHGSGDWLNFTDKGIITIELLSNKNFEKHYVEGLFAPTDLIEIFKHLLIATPFRLFSSQGVTQDTRLYMPSLLSLLPPSEVNEKRAVLLETELIPLVLQFKSNWQCCGVFCCLQVYLIKECEWKVEMDDRQPPCRNFVQFMHQEVDCSITLIDWFSFLEIHCSSNLKDILLMISKNILSGLQSAYKALKYTYEDPEVAFLFPHKLPNSLPPSTEACASHQVPHPALVLVKSNVMRCTICKKMTYALGKGHEDWLSVMNVASTFLLQSSILENETFEEDPLASGQRKKLLPSDEEVDTLSKRQMNDVIVQELSSEKDPNKRESANQPIVLTQTNILKMCESLNSASKDWFKLGLALGVKLTDLKNIEGQYPCNKRRLTEMLGKRLEVTNSEHPVTWPYICDCLRHPTVERNDVADEIEVNCVRTATAVAHIPIYHENLTGSTIETRRD